LKFIFTLFLFGFVGWLQSHAQYEKLLHKPYKEKVLGVHAMYKDLIDIKDSVQRAKRAEEIKTFARKNHDRGLELEVYFFEVFWNAFYQNQPKEIALKALKDQLALVSEENIDFLRARALRALAEFYWKKEQNYELAFEQYIQLDKELNKTKPQDYPEMARDLMQIGQSYYYFQDYPQAIVYFKKAIKIPENSFNTGVLNDARNTLGLCYQQLNQLDSADLFFNAVINTKFIESKVWKRIAAGNLGNSMYLRRQYDKALPLIENDFNSSVVENDNGCAAGASILLADIFRDKGDFEKAGTYINHAKHYIKQSGQTDRLRLLYPIMSKWYAANGDIEKSKQYIDSALSAFNAYNEKFSALKVLRAQQKVDNQKAQLQLADKQRKIVERNLMIAISIALGIALVLGYNILKKRQQAVEIAKLRVERELQDAQEEISRFIDKINEQSKLSRKINEELKKLKNAETEERFALEKTIADLRLSKILTDDDWLSFRKHFTKIYPNFISQLKSNFPTLTDAELRYLMLTKLQLSHKEMAHALGISADAVRVTWNRVRKKLGGKVGETPLELIA
jgi:tetratricopeptide (TPR) repeat protein